MTIEPQTLSSGLVLRCANNPEDVEKIAVFNESIFGPAVGVMTRSLFLHHPDIEFQDLLLVEDPVDGRVISSLCLIPYTIHLDGVQIPCGEMGIVGTDEAYRGQGLVRCLVKAFNQRLADRGCLLSNIEGIPYYYRQFGYEYALPLDMEIHLELRHIPNDNDPLHSFRPAAEADLPRLKQAYDEAAKPYAIHSVRSLEIWKYQFHHTKGGETDGETILVETPTGDFCGYLRLRFAEAGLPLTVFETSNLDGRAAQSAMTYLRRRAEEAGASAIRFGLPRDSRLTQLALSLGAKDHGNYAWQMMIPDPAALLRALGPVLERRLAEGGFAGLSETLSISLYRSRIDLVFEEGHLTAVTSEPLTGMLPFSFPPDAFIQLILGWRTWRELREIYPDAIVFREQRLLADVLFPKLNSFIYVVF